MIPREAAWEVKSTMGLVGRHVPSYQVSCGEPHRKTTTTDGCLPRQRQPPSPSPSAMAPRLVIKCPPPLPIPPPLLPILAPPRLPTFLRTSLSSSSANPKLQLSGKDTMADVNDLAFVKRRREKKGRVKKDRSKRHRAQAVSSFHRDPLPAVHRCANQVEATLFNYPVIVSSDALIVGLEVKLTASRGPARNW